MVEWRRVVGLEDFLKISSNGDIVALPRLISGRKSITPEHKLASYINRNGYEYVDFQVDNKIYKLSVHREVCKSFIPNPSGLEQVNHIDGNKLNNNISNLEWCSREYNMEHMRKFYNVEKINNKCLNCGKTLSSANAQLCVDCYNKKRRENSKIPSKEVLKLKIRNESFTSIAKEYKVSDNCVRKWCKKENLPFRKKDIVLFSDLDWEKL